jgi:CDP-glycerol glycerophosphotransferase (TagB/SpsB family)
VEWDFERENIYSIKKADVMVSDYSGIMMDYMFLRNKPVFYIVGTLDLRSRDTFQIYKNQNEMWAFRSLKKTSIEIKPDMLDELPDLIKKASSDTALESAITELKTSAWCYQRTAGKHTADFMIKTAEAFLETA